jgi:hypothetical protein
MNNISGIVKSARKIMRHDTGTGSDELRILQLGWMLFLKDANEYPISYNCDYHQTPLAPALRVYYP